MFQRAAGWMVGIAAAVLATSAAGAGGPTAKLELKRLDGTPSTAEEAAFRCTYPQYFYIRSGADGLLRAPRSAPNFSQVIRKEPAKYRTKTPFRGVARLGTQYFGFVLDTSRKPGERGPERTETGAGLRGPRGQAQPGPQPVHYDRLLFDFNHNGDLTDDRVISATSADRVLSSRDYATYSFPRVDLPIDSDGVSMEYGFFFSVYSYATSDYWYASASLNAAVYRDGQITLDGRKRRIVLVDFNSNGRFDDEATVGRAGTSQRLMAHVSPGDMVYIDPDRGGDDWGRSLLPVGEWQLASYTIDRTGARRLPRGDGTGGPDG